MIPQARSPGGGRIGGYELVRELGRGGMGAVYEARREADGVRVALKLLLEADPSPEALARFRAEAAAAAALDHPGLVRVLEAGVERGHPFMVMELVEGESLAQRLKREGPLPAAEVARLGRELADALDFMHARGVLHRDVKPANVFLAGDRARLGDFGLARDERREQLTRTGQILGTPEFMPPEQADGQPGALDARADVYALGATLYALLTGRPPFQGGGFMQVLARVMSEPPTPPSRLRPGLDPTLEEVVLRCLAKRPEERPPSAAAVAEALDGWLAGAGPARRGPSGLALGAAVALLVIGGLAAALILGRRASPSPSVPPPAPAPPPPTPDPTPPAPDPAGLRARARELLERRHWSELDAALAELLAAAPEDAEAWSLRGEALLIRASYRDTERGEIQAAVEKACELDSGSARARALRALDRFDRGDDAGLAADATEALRLDGVAALSWTAEGCNRLRRVLSDSRRGQDVRGALAEQVLEAFQRALAAGSDAFLVHTKRLEAAYLLLNTGVIAWPEAQVVRDALLAALPDDAYALTKAGWLTKWLAEVSPAGSRAGEAAIREALALLDRAIAIDPELWYAWDQRGYTRRLGGDLPGAVEDLRRALPLTREADPAFLLGGAYLQLNQLREAVAALDEALARQPRNGTAYFQRGWAHAQLQERTLAIDDLRQALALEDPQGRTYQQAAALLSELGAGR